MIMSNDKHKWPVVNFINVSAFFVQIFQQSQNVTRKTTFVRKICTYYVDEIDTCIDFVEKFEYKNILWFLQLHAVQGETISTLQPPRSAVSNTRPANITKNGYFKRNIGPIGRFSQKHWILTQFFWFIFKCGPPDLAFSLMRPARHFEFETLALDNAYIVLSWRKSYNWKLALKN